MGIIPDNIAENERHETAVDRHRAVEHPRVERPHSNYQPRHAKDET
jgi:hypothetical protein